MQIIQCFERHYKCRSAGKVKELNYVLTPGLYVGLAEQENYFDFKERFTQLKSEFEEQLKEGAELNERIEKNLDQIKINGEK